MTSCQIVLIQQRRTTAPMPPRDLRRRRAYGPTGYLPPLSPIPVFRRLPRRTPSTAPKEVRGSSGISPEIAAVRGGGRGGSSGLLVQSQRIRGLRRKREF